MAKRQNTVVCSFDPSSQRIPAYDTHEWLHAAVRIRENTVSINQIDGIKRQAFIKFVDKESVHALLRDTAGRAENKYNNGEISIVTIDIARMGTKCVRVVNLSPEVLNETLHGFLASFGKVLTIYAEKWAKIYRAPCQMGCGGL